MDAHVFLILVVAPAVFALLYLLLIWFIKNRKNRILASVIGTLVLTPLIIHFGMVVYVFSLMREPSREFSAELWKENPRKRFQMADHLIASGTLNGLDTVRLVHLLGKPEWRESQHNAWNYDMGEGGGGLGWLFHTLRVQFRNDTVSGVQHIHVQD